MSIIQFNAVKAQERRIESLLNAEFPAVIRALEPHSHDAALTVQALQDELRRQWHDFSSAERKLNIAVIGRVKAGKSTFLNTVIFDGHHVLPQAFTPKTASLTKIEYAEQNALAVEFYTPKEWAQMESAAHSGAATENARMAKELVEATRQSGIAVNDILAQGTIEHTFSSDEELAAALNQYTGADGSCTPLVKCVTLYQSNPNLAGISIVDTPGMNDPVVSRTQRTREFLADCDVVFFLSQASQFLDENDVDLLKNQLPQKGVARLILLVSRFDDALMDVIYDMDSLAEAVQDTKERLRRQAKKIFRTEAQRLAEAGNARCAELFQSCTQPLFLSSFLHNMIGKSPSDYTDAEQKRADALDEYGDFAENLAEIGDLAPILDELAVCIAEKDQTLLKKVEGFVPRAKESLQKLIADEQKETARRISVLETGDGTSIEHERRQMEQKIHEIQARLEEYFGTITSNIEQAKIDVLRKLREDNRTYSSLSTKTGVEYEEHSRKVSDSKWYNPFSWGSSHTEYYTTERRYSYLDVNDALENIRNYGREASSDIERTFADNIHLQTLKQQLLKRVVESLDAGREDYDPAYFRLLAERSLQKIELPVVQIDVSAYLDSLTGRWSGEVRDSSDRSALQAAHAAAMSQLFDAISACFTEEVPRLKSHLDAIKDGFGKELLQSMESDYQKLQAACLDKDRSIQKLRDYAKTLATLENH